jgi:uncharacterized membrane protein
VERVLLAQPLLAVRFCALSVQLANAVKIAKTAHARVPVLLDFARSKEMSMTPAEVLLLAFLIGVVSGLRSLTAPAVVAWAAHLGWIHLNYAPLNFLGSAAAVAVFTLFAIVELVADQLPRAPSRTAPPGLIARIVLGALCGAAIAASGAQSTWIGAFLGAAGGVAGAFGGYQVRTRLVKALKVPDFVIATLEDAVAIGAGLLIVSRF